jgi:ribosome biogenesis GTPase
MNLEDLGYGPFFESQRVALGLSGYEVARVIAEYKEAYRVKNTANEYLARISGRQMFKAKSREDYPCIGDWAAITPLNDREAVIHRLLPRRTVLRRKYSNKTGAQLIGANIDTAFIVESVGRDYNLNRFERYFIMVDEGHIRPSIIINKIDLISRPELELNISQLKTRFKDIDVIAVSAATGQGMDNLADCIKNGKTYCFLGSSGVGKSSLINKLLGGDRIKTESINLVTGQGRHTTAGRNMYFLAGGGLVIDNPGMKEIGLTGARNGLSGIFEPIITVAAGCKYKDCSHTNERGCAVLAALDSGQLNKEQYAKYLRLKKESEYYEMTELEKRRSDRKFGRFIKKAQQQLKKKY